MTASKAEGVEFCLRCWRWREWARLAWGGFDSIVREEVNAERVEGGVRESGVIQVVVAVSCALVAALCACLFRYGSETASHPRIAFCQSSTRPPPILRQCTIEHPGRRTYLTQHKPSGRANESFAVFFSVRDCDAARYIVSLLMILRVPFSQPGLDGTRRRLLVGRSARDCGYLSWLVQCLDRDQAKLGKLWIALGMGMRKAQRKCW